MDMDTIVDPATGLASASATSATHPARNAGLHKNRPSLLYRRIMHSWLMQPYRRLLHPLWAWTWKPHISIPSGAGPSERVYVNLKPPSTFALVMSVVLGPLIFLMLLPLILILIPVAMVVGVLAILIASLQSEADETVHHSLAEHLME
jgi:hypothetical protein